MSFEPREHLTGYVLHVAISDDPEADSVELSPKITVEVRDGEVAIRALSGGSMAEWARILCP